MIVKRNWWLRSPNTTNSNNVRNVNTSGELNNNNANNANGLVPDCVELGELKVSQTSKGLTEIKAIHARNHHLASAQKAGRIMIIDTALLTVSNWGYKRYDE
jgi:hypothetical protein